MYANISQREPTTGQGKEPQHQRIKASATASFKFDDNRTRLDRLYQHASAKIRFPKHYGGALETVLINTAGGLTGGDEIDWNLVLGGNTDVVTTTQACEKAYKSTGSAATVRNSISLGKSSKLHWLPQETILYNGSSLARNLDVELADQAEFLALESVVLGREAMGEVPQAIKLRDRWRIKRNGKLVFADDFYLTDQCNGRAQLNGKRVVATLVYIGNQDDETLTQMSKRLSDLAVGVTSGFSAFDGKLTARMVCQDSYSLRQVLAPVLNQLRGTNLPQVWRI